MKSLSGRRRNIRFRYAAIFPVFKSAHRQSAFYHQTIPEAVIRGEVTPSSQRLRADVAPARKAQRPAGVFVTPALARSMVTVRASRRAAAVKTGVKNDGDLIMAAVGGDLSTAGAGRRQRSQVTARSATRILGPYWVCRSAPMPIRSTLTPARPDPIAPSRRPGYFAVSRRSKCPPPNGHGPRPSCGRRTG